MFLYYLFRRWGHFDKKRISLCLVGSIQRMSTGHDLPKCRCIWFRGHQERVKKSPGVHGECVGPQGLFGWSRGLCVIGLRGFSTCLHLDHRPWGETGFGATPEGASTRGRKIAVQSERVSSTHRRGRGPAVGGVVSGAQCTSMCSGSLVLLYGSRVGAEVGSGVCRVSRGHG